MPRDHAPPDRTLLIATKALTRVFDRRAVVDHVNLRVQRGEIFALIGPAGAGKSTLLKMITTLLRPTSGDARIAGADLRREPARVRQRIGYVPQAPSIDGGLTARENLELAARLYLIAPAERAARVEDALLRTRLSGDANRAVHTLSDGLRRSLEIACSTLHHPALLILDEPTAGLDPAARDEVWRHIRELRQRYGTSILLTTPVMAEAEALAGRIGLMHDGRLERVGTADELRKELAGGATLDDIFAHVTGAPVPGGMARHPASSRVKSNG